MKQINIAVLLVFALLSQAKAKVEQQSQESSSSDIIQKFVKATESGEEGGRGVSMQVDIDASLPKLKEHGRLRALRKISRVGQITYQLLGFQGDNTVKNQVIARYLQAEKQGQGDQSFAISPSNYRFKYKGKQKTSSGQQVYAFQLTPTKKKVGLYRGDLWVDPASYLPVMEKGRLVKNPSIFFKKVDFERDFQIQNGSSVPAHMSSTIETRLFGRVLLNIDYSNYQQDSDGSTNKIGTQVPPESTTN